MFPHNPWYFNMGPYTSLPPVLMWFSSVTLTMKLTTCPASCPYRRLNVSLSNLSFHSTLATCSFEHLLVSIMGQALDVKMNLSWLTPSLMGLRVPHGDKPAGTTNTHDLGSVFALRSWNSARNADGPAVIPTCSFATSFPSLLLRYLLCCF